MLNVNCLYFQLCDLYYYLKISSNDSMMYAKELNISLIRIYVG